MFKHLRIFVIVSAAALISALGIFSATASAAPPVAGGTFTVTATVVANCSVSTAATDILFGPLDPTSVSSDTYVPDSIGINCTKNTAFTVLMNAGNNPITAGDVTTRQMSDGTNKLAYHLCSADPCTGDIANSTTPPSGTVNLSGTGAGGGTSHEVTENFWGEVKFTDLQTAVASTGYTDTITVQISF